LNIDFGIEGLSSEATAEFSTATLRLSDGTIFKPKEISTWSGVFPDACISGWIDLKKLSTQEYSITASARYFRLLFPMPNDTVEDCVVELGSLIVNGERVAIPPIELKKTAIFGYRPFIMPLPR